MDTYSKTTPSYKQESPTPHTSLKVKAMEAINKVKASIPAHLQKYIVDQSPQNYTSEDQAVWRYTLRQLKHFLKQHAHDVYSDGLAKTGITVNEIPTIELMCLRLQEFGWSAVPVSGFLPPAAFMELQSLSILPIASDMRSIDHIFYTPAPDIVHEAAGHAPILVDPQFAEYLKSYAKIAKRALISHEDLAQYSAIRELSDIKENPNSTEDDIKKAELKLSSVNQNMTFVSEAALLGRMNWWTAEYGLIGSLEAPKIYGAGLLSSFGEAKNYLNPSVEKIPLSIDCINYSYDITEQQPQLFVAESFTQMTQVLNELAEQMAFSIGGLYGLKKAIQCQTIATIQLDSGLQISGQITEHIEQDGTPIFYKLNGGTQLSFESKQLPHHGKDRHPDGFSAPLGNHQTEKKGHLTIYKFNSGIRVEGRVLKTLSRKQSLIVVTLDQCTMSYNDQILYRPEWGEFDLAVGTEIKSVFAGPADSEAFGEMESFTSAKVPVKKRSSEFLKIDSFYLILRKMRKKQDIDPKEIQMIVDELSLDPKSWLLRLEILELIERGWVDMPTLGQKLHKDLLEFQKKEPRLHSVIAEGLQIVDLIY